MPRPLQYAISSDSRLERWVVSGDIATWRGSFCLVASYNKDRKIRDGSGIHLFSAYTCIEPANA